MSRLHFSTRKLLISFLILSFSFTSISATSATPKPKFNVGCFDQSSTGSYSGRAYIEYAPTLSANFYGKKALVHVFVNNVKQWTIEYSRNTTSYSNLAFINAPVRFYKDNVVLGKNSFKFIFQDSKKNKSMWTCNTTLYDSSFGLANSGLGSSSSGLFGCSYNGVPLYGSVYFTSSSYSADFSVYVSSSSYSSDLSVYLTSSSYSANSCGLWYPVSSSYSADFTVYLTSSSYSADFSIYRTSSSYSAGTN
jgi:hypothetical protein